MADVNTELVIFFRSLATLQGAGVHVLRSLEVLGRQLDNREVKAALVDALRQVSSGMPLSKALSRHPRLFKPLHLQMLRVGENSGGLHRVLENLAVHAEKSFALQQKLRSAMVYPALIMVLALVMLIALPGIVFKDLLRFLSDLHVELPWATKVLLGLSNLVTQWWFFVLLGLVAAGLGWGVVQLSRRPAWQEAAEQAIISVPGLGPAVTAGWVADFTRSLSYTYAAGVPILQALEIAGQGRSLLMNRALANTRKQMAEGLPLHRCLSMTGLFPPMALHLIQAGEESGQVADMLERVANACEELVDERLTLASAMLQPLVMLVVGLVVGFMVVAVMSPMLKVLESL